MWQVGVSREQRLIVRRQPGSELPLFLQPNRVISPGITGIGMLLNYRWGLPIGMMTLAINDGDQLVESICVLTYFFDHRQQFAEHHGRRAPDGIAMVNLITGRGVHPAIVMPHVGADVLRS